MRVEVKDDNGALVFSLNAPPLGNADEPCLCPARADSPQIIAALEDAITFLGSPTLRVRPLQEERPVYTEIKLPWHRYIGARIGYAMMAWHVPWSAELYFACVLPPGTDYEVRTIEVPDREGP